MRYDIKNGIIRNLQMFIPVIFLSFCHCISMDMSFKDHHPALANYVIGFFRGVEPINLLGDDIRFEIPVIWLLFYIYLTYLVGHYPYKDLDSFGKLVMIKGNSRVKWWISKCIWNMVVVITYYLCIYVVMLAFSAVHNGIFIKPDKLLIERMSGVSMDGVSLKPLIVVKLCVILPVLISLGMSLVQMCMALFIRPVYANIVFIILILGTAHECKEYLINNYLMFIRSCFVVGSDGVRYSVGITIAICMIIVGIAVGIIKIRRKDIITDES